MQKPPSRPPVLFNRPTYEWINRVSQKHKHFAALDLNSKQKESVARWVETGFVYSTLALEGVDVSREQIARFASPPATGNEAAVAHLLASLREAWTHARNDGLAAVLTPELLLRLNDPSGEGEAGFRKTAAGAKGPFKPVPAEHLSAIIESACLWFAAESFTELTPVEQASIVHLRMLEIQPFEASNQRMAFVAASLFTLRSQLPPVIVTHERASAYRAALNEGLRMDTKPMVELMAEAIEATLDGMIDLAEGK